MDKFEGNFTMIGFVVKRFILHNYNKHYARFIEAENFIREDVLVDVHSDNETYEDQDFVISEQQSNEAESEKENDIDKRK